MSESSNGMNRRGFLRNSALGIVGAGVVGSQGTLFSQEEKKTQTENNEELTIKQYRMLGRTGFKVSDISSGGPQNLGVTNALLDSGVNYIDTAENYSQGKSEEITGQALKGRDRKKFFVTTKIALKPEDTKETIINRTHKCLKRLDMAYVDCMMIHSAPTAETIKNEAFHAAMDQMKSEGKVRFVGVSNHGPQWRDTGDSMEKVLMAAADDGRFDVFLMVYNFLQKEAGDRILQKCREKNIGVTLMKVNPIGGYLSTKEDYDKKKAAGEEIPGWYEPILAKLKAVADKAQGWADQNKLKNPAEIRDAAIKFCLNHDMISTVCCSITNFDQVDGFLKLSGSVITNEEKKKLALYQQGCSQLYCRHACGICESKCPNQVPVNTILRYNHYFQAQGREKHAMQKYAALTTAKADVCSTCTGICETACPYGVPAQGLLTLAHQRLILS